MLKQLTFILLIFACSCEETDTINNSYYFIQPNAYFMVADGAKTLELNLLQNTIAPNKSHTIRKMEGDNEYFHNGQPLHGNIFSTTQVGDHKFYAMYKGLKIEEITITARAPKDYERISIPLIFHVVYDNEPVGQGANISNEYIEDIVSKVNLQFGNTYYTQNNPEETRSPNHVDTKIEFRLARYDPEGNTMIEQGVKRYGGYKNISGDLINKIINDNMWSVHSYINITTWKDNTGTFGGASMPFSDSEHLLCGLKEVSASTWEEYREEMYQKGYSGVTHEISLPTTLFFDWTVTHELGHYLGLMHVFSASCDDKQDCIEDTQHYNQEDYYELSSGRGIFYDCNTTYLITHDNYMGGYYKERDYRTGSIPSYYGFTYDQRDRMRAVLDHSPWIKDLRFSSK